MGANVDTKNRPGTPGEEYRGQGSPDVSVSKAPASGRGSVSLMVSKGVRGALRVLPTPCIPIGFTALLVVVVSLTIAHIARRVLLPPETGSPGLFDLVFYLNTDQWVLGLGTGESPPWLWLLAPSRRPRRTVVARRTCDEKPAPGRRRRTAARRVARKHPRQGRRRSRRLRVDRAVANPQSDLQPARPARRGRCGNLHRGRQMGEVACQENAPQLMLAVQCGVLSDIAGSGRMGWQTLGRERSGGRTGEQAGRRDRSNDGRQGGGGSPK